MRNTKIMSHENVLQIKWNKQIGLIAVLQELAASRAEMSA